MTNQYTKAALFLETQLPNDSSKLNISYTEAFFELLKKQIPQDQKLIDEFIAKLREEP